MLISYSRPASITWAIVNNNPTHAVLTAPNGFGSLCNGRPADATLLQWAQTGSSLITDSCSLVGTLAPQLVGARLGGLIMSNIASAMPAGVRVELSAKLGAGAVALNGNSLSQRTQLLPSGAIAIWWALPVGITAIDTIIITIYNDKNGAVWLPNAANTIFSVGEAWIGKGADFAISLDAIDELDGGLQQRQSHNNQAWPLQRQPYRVYTANLVPMTEALMLGPLSYQDDFQTVRNALSTQSACVLVPYYLKTGNAPYGAAPTVTSGTINAQRLHRSAQLGVLDSPIRIAGNGDVYFVAPITHGETPP